MHHDEHDIQSGRLICSILETRVCFGRLLAAVAPSNGCIPAQFGGTGGIAARSICRTLGLMGCPQERE
jgi:hypothetical protein